MVQALYDDYINGTDSDDSDQDNMSHVGNVSRGGDDEASGRVSRDALYAGDLWALGASLYFLLTGDYIAPQYDWESPKLQEVFDAILAFKLPKRKAGSKTALFHDDIAIDRVICTCLQADPSKRSTAGELLQQLKDEYEESEDEEEDEEDDDEEEDEDEEAEEDELVDVVGESDDDGGDESNNADEDDNKRNDRGRRKRAPARNGRRPAAAAARDDFDDGVQVRRTTRGKVASAVILSPMPTGRERQRKAPTPAEPAIKKRVRATDDKDPRGYVLSPVASPRRSKRRGVVILPTLTPRTLRQRNRQLAGDETASNTAAQRRRRKAEGDAADDENHADDEVEEDEDEDEDDNEAAASAIEAPAPDEDEDKARRIRINERLRARIRQAAAAASSSRSYAVSPRRSSRQRPAPAIDGTLSSDDHDPPRSTSGMRTRAAAARSNKRRW